MIQRRGIRAIALGLASLGLWFGLHFSFNKLMPQVQGGAAIKAVATTVTASPTPALSPAEPAEPKSAVPPDHIKVYLTLIGIDPIKGEVDGRLEFEPQGAFTEDQGFSLAEGVKLGINSVDKQGSQILFKPGKPMDAAVVKFVIYDGDANHYPFDQHQAEIVLFMETTPAQADQIEAVPVVVETYASIPGFEVEITPQKDSTPDNYSLDVTIARSFPVLGFSVVVMVIMWVLSVMVLLMAIGVIRGGRVPEPPLLGFVGALIFALPALRNAQPNIPPVGVLSDFLSFFWNEVLVALAVVIMCSCWLRRYPKVISK